MHLISELRLRSCFCIPVEIVLQKYFVKMCWWSKNILFYHRCILNVRRGHFVWCVLNVLFLSSLWSLCVALLCHSKVRLVVNFVCLVVLRNVLHCSNGNQLHLIFIFACVIRSYVHLFLFLLSALSLEHSEFFVNLLSFQKHVISAHKYLC